MPSLSEETNIEDKRKMYTTWAFTRNSLKKKKRRNYCSQDFPAGLVVKTEETKIPHPGWPKINK